MKTLTIKNLLDSNSLKKAINSIKSRGKKLDSDIQLAVCSAIQNHAEHYSTTLTNQLVEAMPKGSRVNALREFIETFSGMSYSQEEKCFVNDKSKKADIKGAMGSVWTDFKPEPQFKGFDLEASIKKLLDQAVKMAGDENPEHQSKIKLDLEQLQQLGDVVGMEISIAKEAEEEAEEVLKKAS